MPLVWAHAEYAKLLRSLRDGRIFDQPPQTVTRYASGARQPRVAAWRITAARRQVNAGRVLRIDTPDPARIRWTSNGWATWQDLESRAVSAGVHSAEVPTAALAAGTTVSFTLYWPAANRWEGRNFAVQIVPA